MNQESKIMNKNFYITTTLPYVNAEPHIGFAAEIVRADAIARYKRLAGHEVFFNTGTDEHGLKIYRKAKERGKDPQDYVNKYAAKFDNLKQALNLSYNSFTRTTDKNHIRAAQEFWRRCDKNGDIYKKNYSVKYCVGCELEKTESELANGRCPHHPDYDLEIIEEENYFFRWRKYGDKLLELYKNNPGFILPKHRINEISNFIKNGLEDFSISRLKEKMPWGVPVPNDPKHVMYVWFDALVNYISCLGWPSEKGNFKKFWPGMQVAGKDNLRQQTAMWQAMLMSAGLPNSTQILIFGFITSDGQKMSKSRGNAVNPYELVNKYGTDAVRYYLLADLNPYEDSDYTQEKFKIRYTADLANGLGNLVSRTANLIEKNKFCYNFSTGRSVENLKGANYHIEKFRFNIALEALWRKLREMDEYLSEKAPWKMEDASKKREILNYVGQNIIDIAYMLQPFMPETAEKILIQFTQKQIKKGEPLFPRLEN
ncbi:MAG: methionine--tRNA ligase [Patescibacteria group bacterium]|nr:methionine--tRNA ligase [Patescibacteria group bacterium]